MKVKPTIRFYYIINPMVKIKKIDPTKNSRMWEQRNTQIIPK